MMSCRSVTSLTSYSAATENNYSNHNGEDAEIWSDNGILPLQDAEQLDHNDSTVRKFCDNYCRRKWWCNKHVVVLLLGLLFLAVGASWLVGLLVDRAANKASNDTPSMEQQHEQQQQRRQQDADFLAVRRSLVEHHGASGWNLLQPNSSQKTALRWMVYHDETLASPWLWLSLTLEGNHTIFTMDGFNGTKISTNNKNNNDENNTTRQVPLPPLDAAFLQRYALVVLYYATSGNHWETVTTVSNEADPQSSEPPVTNAPNLTSNTTVQWQPAPSRLLQPSAHECDWEWVVCDNTTHHVLELNLGKSAPRLTLRGTLPPELGYLTELQRLDVSDNRLYGSLPTRLYELTRLEVLDVSGNELSSQLDLRMGQWIHLRELLLHQNQFHGDLPWTIQRLSHLQVVSLANNPNLSGPIFAYAGRAWSKLILLNLENTALSGSITTNMGTLTQLRELVLYNLPYVTGTIPTELGKLSLLENFRLSSTQQVGSLPSEIGQWTNLEYFVVEDMDMEWVSSIPVEVGHWRRCLHLEFSRSPSIRGIIPTQLGLLTKLQVVDVHNTELSGTIPSELGMLSDCQFFAFDETKIHGTMPQQLCQLQPEHLSADCQPESNFGVPAQLQCSMSDCCTECRQY